MNELCRVFFEIFQEDYIAPDAPDDVTSLIEALAAINTRLDAANLAYAQMESRVTALTLALEAARNFLPSLNETRAQLILDQHSLAVIGLGGTGAYLLDFLVKTPVREIRAYDLDGFHVHNSFRSPGRLNEPELGKPKAEVYHSRYENFRTGLSVTSMFIDASCSEELDGVTFAFVCVDKGSSRAAIFELLISRGIPFIDVGMGLKRKGESLTGMLRATYYSAEEARKLRDMGLAELADSPDDLYRANIQIGELNALNASLAIIRFKQLRGFYFEELPHYDLTFGIGDMKTIGEWEISAT